MAGLQDPQNFKELGFKMALPEGWIKHPDEPIWRPEEDDGKTFPPTLMVDRFPDATLDDFVAALKKNFDSDKDTTFLEDEEKSVNRSPGMLLAYRAKSTQFLFNQVVTEGKNGGVTSFVFYGPEKTFSKERRKFQKVMRSVKWLKKK